MQKVLIFLYILFLLFSHFNNKSFAIEGCFCGPNSSCYSDGCTRKTIKGDGSIDYNLCGSAGCGGAYNACYKTDSVEVNRYFCLEQPPCCEEMVRRNNPEACCWPERGYCHPNYCEKVSRPEKCGWYWRWHDNIPDLMRSLNGYGCVRGTSPNSLEPVYGLPKIASDGFSPSLLPSFNPTPTKQITFQPTDTIIPTPSFIRIPTDIIIPTPVTPPIYTPPPIYTYTPPPIYNFKENLLKSIREIKKVYQDTIFISKAKLKKISEPSKKIFFEFKQIDKSIEEYFNEKLLFLIYKNFKSLFST